MLKGYIKTFGEKAITIQTAGGNQYYGPFENIKDPEIFDYLTKKYNLNYIPVKFLINLNKHSGRTKYGKRYYAFDIELDDLVF